jgi:uroporphyrinogen decarboxylase
VTVESSPLLRACRGERSERVPVWFMRQAGRALPEYRELRRSSTMLEACTDSSLITEITLQPVRRYGVDAAILFSDIVLPLTFAGVDLTIEPGVGPVIAHPVRSQHDVDLIAWRDEDLGFLRSAVGSLVSELGDVPLIGFAGAPFTLASYLIEGGPSRDHALTKALMYAEPQLWHALLDRLVGVTGHFLATQIDAGVSVVQLFDSWAGTLSAADYATYVLPHTTELMKSVAVPWIHFGVNTGELLTLMASAGPDVVGVDWRLPLDDAVRRLGGDAVVQGNLDPAVCLAPWEVVAERTHDVLRRGAEAPAHIFNLGHGVLPSTNPDVLARLVDLVHSYEG